MMQRDVLYHPQDNINLKRALIRKAPVYVAPHPTDNVYSDVVVIPEVAVDMSEEENEALNLQKKKAIQDFLHRTRSRSGEYIHKLRETQTSSQQSSNSVCEQLQSICSDTQRSHTRAEAQSRKLESGVTLTQCSAGEDAILLSHNHRREAFRQVSKLPPNEDSNKQKSTSGFVRTKRLQVFQDQAGSPFKKKQEMQKIVNRQLLANTSGNSVVFDQEGSICGNMARLLKAPVEESNLLISSSLYEVKVTDGNLHPQITITGSLPVPSPRAISRQYSRSVTPLPVKPNNFLFAPIQEEEEHAVLRHSFDEKPNSSRSFSFPTQLNVAPNVQNMNNTRNIHNMSLATMNIEDVDVPEVATIIRPPSTTSSRMTFISQTPRDTQQSISSATPLLPSKQDLQKKQEQKKQRAQQQRLDRKAKFSQLDSKTRGAFSRQVAAMAAQADRRKANKYTPILSTKSVEGMHMLGAAGLEYMVHQGVVWPLSVQRCMEKGHSLQQACELEQSPHTQTSADVQVDRSNVQIKTSVEVKKREIEPSKQEQEERAAIAFSRQATLQPVILTRFKTETVQAAMRVARGQVSLEGFLEVKGGNGKSRLDPLNIMSRTSDFKFTSARRKNNTIELGGITFKVEGSDIVSSTDEKMKIAEVAQLLDTHTKEEEKQHQRQPGVAYSSVVQKQERRRQFHGIPSESDYVSTGGYLDNALRAAYVQQTESLQKEEKQKVMPVNHNLSEGSRRLAVTQNSDKIVVPVQDGLGVDGTGPSGFYREPLQIQEVTHDVRIIRDEHHVQGNPDTRQMLTGRGVSIPQVAKKPMHGTKNTNQEDGEVEVLQPKQAKWR